MFKKKAITAESLTTSLTNVVDVFNVAITNLANVVANATDTIYEHNEEIKTLQAENEALKQVSERAISIKEKLESLIK